MATLSGFRINIIKRGEVIVPKFVIANLGLALDDTVLLAVSSSLSRVFLSRTDIEDELYPQNYLRPAYARVKNKSESSFILYSAAFLQIAGPDFEVGVYSKYRRILDGSGKVRAITFSRSADDKAKQKTPSKAPENHCLTPLLEQCFAKVLENTPTEKPDEIPFLAYETLRQQGYLDRNGCYTKKAFSASSTKTTGG